MAQLIGIKYIGRKAFPRVDNMLGTGLTWEDEKREHLIPAKIARTFLAYPDVWGQTRVVEVSDSKSADLEGDLSPVAAPKLVEDVQLAPLVQLDSMDDNALREFAQRQFGQKLHPQMTEKNMRVKIRNMMNSPVTG